VLNNLRILAENRNLDVVLIAAPDNLDYYTDVPSLGDALGLLVYDRRSDSLSLYVPLLEYQRYRDKLPDTVNVYALSKTLKPSGISVIEADWKDIIKQYASDKIGVDLSHSGPLQKTLQQVLGEKAVDVSDDIWKQRMIKSNRELEAIKRAVRITIKGVLAVQSSIREDITETQLVGVFEKTVRDNGVSKLAFDPIIAFKPNNAYPHAVPGERRVSSRDLVLVDVGVKVDNRCSDITRMILYGRPSPEEKKSIEAVVEAVEAAIDSVAPGVKAGDVYNTAVKILEKYGLKEYFIHGLGHGVGVVVHEPPYLRLGSETILEPGMVFTIEPGVYFPGKYGVRVEEVVVVTKKGRKVLSRRLDGVLEAF